MPETRNSSEDEHWRVVSANRAFCSMFRTDLSHLVGVPIDAVFDGNLGLAEVAASLRSFAISAASALASAIKNSNAAETSGEMP